MGFRQLLIPLFVLLLLRLPQMRPICNNASNYIIVVIPSEDLQSSDLISYF